MANKNLGSLVAVISANTKPFNKAMNQMNYTLNSSLKNVDKIGRSMSMAFTAPIGLLAGRGVQVFREFEFQMAKVQAVSGATADEFKALSDNAKELGASTRFTAAEVAMLQTEYAKLGFTADEITKVTGATLALAQASDTDLARAAEVAGSTLRSFGMDASETGKLTDVMAAAFSSTALDMESFAESMKYVAPVAKSAGLSVEETTAMLGTMANAGIKGSQAGTSLRRIISELGATGGDVAGSIKNLATQGLNLADAKDEVGRTAQSALLVLSEGTATTDDLTASLSRSEGAAKRMADTMDQTMEGSFKKMQSAVEGAQLAIGEALAPAVSSVADTIAKASSAFTNMSESGQKFVMIVGGIVAAIGPAMLATSQMIRSYGVLRVTITRGVIPALQRMIALMMANPYLVAAAAVAALGYAMSDYVSFTEPAAAATEQFNDAQTSAAALAAKNGAEVQRLADKVRDESLAEGERLAALQKLQSIAPDYFGQLDMERVKMGELETAVDAYKDSLLRAAQTKVFTQKLEESVAKMEELKAEAEEGPGMFDKLLGSMTMFGMEAGGNAAMMSRLSGEMAEQQALIDKYTTALNDLEMQQTSAASATNSQAESTNSQAEAIRNATEAAREAEEAFDATANSLESLNSSMADDDVDVFAPEVPEDPFAGLTLDYPDIEPPIDDDQLDSRLESLENMEEKMGRVRSAAEQLGNSFGQAFGQLADKSSEADEVLKSLGMSVVKTMLQIAKSAIMASAAQASTAAGPAGLALAPALIAGGLSLVEAAFGAIAFADGGIVSGPTLGLVGEYSGARSNPEVIAPLDKLRGMIQDTAGGAQNIVVSGKFKGGDIALAAQTGNRKLRRTR